MSDMIRSIVFATVMCLVCGTLLTAASSGLKAKQTQNLLTDSRKNILKSVGLVDPEKKYTPEAISRLYTDHICKLTVDAKGNVITASSADVQNKLPIYLYSDKGGPVKDYIIPINSKGLWGLIHGYLAIEKDGSTIAGFAVYKHSETPGLGGEIEKQWFDQNFVGKKIVNQDGKFVSISIAKGKASDTVPPDRQINYVDGISGATLTGRFLTAGLKQTLTEYEPVSLKFRHNHLNININQTGPVCGHETQGN